MARRVKRTPSKKTCAYHRCMKCGEEGLKFLADSASVELSSKSTRDSEAGVGVGEELLGVLLDLGDGKANAAVLSLHHDTSAEGALKAADSVAALFVANGVRKGNSRRSRLALGSLVDVSGRVGGRLVVSTESIESDVVADNILVGVDAELEKALASLEATSELIFSVHNLVRGGNNLPGRSEGKGDVATLGLEKAKDTLLVLHVRCGRGGSKSTDGNSEERELHVCFGVEKRVSVMRRK